MRLSENRNVLLLLLLIAAILMMWLSHQVVALHTKAWV